MKESFEDINRKWRCAFELVANFLFPGKDGEL